MPKNLTEAGRKLAKRNVTKLKAMQAAIAEMLAEVDGDEDTEEAVQAEESDLVEHELYEAYAPLLGGKDAQA